MYELASLDETGCHHTEAPELAVPDLKVHRKFWSGNVRFWLYRVCLYMNTALYVLSTETIPLLASNFVSDSMQDKQVR